MCVFGVLHVQVAETVYTDVIVKWKDTLLVSVPAFVYMLQNNLLYIATANLDATTCQITYHGLRLHCHARAMALVLHVPYTCDALAVQLLPVQLPCTECTAAMRMLGTCHALAML